MGNGTFNLTAIWRALGIKNPDPSVRETVQPVIIVGDFSHLTPMHRPPTAVFGGDIGGVAAERAIIQVTSRGAGGSLLASFSADVAQTLRYTQVAAIAGLTPLAPSWQMSSLPLFSIVEVGNDPLNPAGAGVSPAMITNDHSVNWGNFPMYMRPGTSTQIWNSTTNSPISAFQLQVLDLPASEVNQ